MASSRSMKFSQTDPDTLSFNMPGNHEQTARIDPLISDVLAWRDDEPVQRFRVIGRSLSKSDGVLTASFSCLSYKALLDAWVFHHTTTTATERRKWPAALSATERKVSEIMWLIVEQGQAFANGDLGIVKFGAAPAGDVTLAKLVGEDGTDYFKPGSTKRAALDDLALTAPGFRWDIVPDPSNPYTGTQMTLAELGEGDVSELLLDDGGTVAGWSHAIAGADYGNILRIGVGDTYTGGFYPSEAGPTTPLEGRWERSEDAQPAEELTSQGEADAFVAKYAPTVYTRIHDAAPEVTVDLRRGRWGGPSDLWIGSQARLLITEPVIHGRTTEDDEYILSIDEEIEVFEVAVNVDDQGAEAVSLSLGRPRYSVSSDLREIDRRVARLERR
jgi:hypothetical protein